MHSPELLKGSLQTIILKLLANNGRMYGYEITQKVKELSDGSLIVSEGALYPTLHKLESEGLLTTEKISMGKRVRKYYTLTSNGKANVVERVKDFEAFIETMFKVLQISPQL
ncbi:PadR family transcriptional regulator [Fulvivirga sp. RKSG066]|uniref:PadR family transcriptional regulator n=1 Tax=Fulvivirga aurantia TaxID=2529383 RepID=UPI0012BB777F|nr:PadR family transcriptional regulator [Fulvivirga aurantia]MTI20345.1 PadR family transcriptional regulator [Fulvivirga aurantia]